MTLKKNKVAWITGGGTGIGKELALILAKQEYDVIISGRRKEKLKETANRNKKSSELRSLGTDPKTKETLVLKEGRYGPYISNGKVNASLGQKYTPDSITLEIAIELINAKKSAPKRKRKSKKKK